VPLALVAPLCWLTFEVNARYASRCLFEGGLPFVQLAFTQANNRVLVQSAEYVGAMGMALTLVLVNTGCWTLLAKLIVPKPGGKVALVFCFLPLGMSLGYGWYGTREESGDEVSIAAVPGRLVVLDEHPRFAVGEPNTASAECLTVDSLKAETPLLYVWGEAALRDPAGDPATIVVSSASDEVVVEGLSQDVNRQLVDLAARLGAPLLVGGLRFNIQESIFFKQSVFLIEAPRGVTAYSDKAALAPVAERSLRVFRWLQRWFGIPAPKALYRKATLSPGGESRPMAIPCPGREPCRIGVCICYDVFFPEVFTGYWQGPWSSRPPDLFVVCSDHSWLNRGWCARYFERLSLAAAQLRAVETRRAIVRTVINGTTAAIDQRGRIVKSQEMPEALKTVFRARVALSEATCGPACRTPLLADASLYLVLVLASLAWVLPRVCRGIPACPPQSSRTAGAAR
jgi:apolipoprotein N-acyltransferase